MARRSFWLLLLLIHVAPLCSAVVILFSSGFSITAAMNLVLLLAAAAFFFLKLVDVRWLRWRSKRAAALSFVLICVLVHDGAAPQAARQALIAEFPTAVAVSVAVEALTRTRNWLPNLRATLSRIELQLPLPVFYGAALEARANDRARLFQARLCIPRAPPA